GGTPPYNPNPGGVPPYNPNPGGNPNPGTGGTTLTVNIRLLDKTFVLGGELPLEKAQYEWMKKELELLAVDLRGAVDISEGPHNRTQELAAALNAYTQKKGAFPRGAYDRTTLERASVPWRPDQRVSWMQELLPFLGSGEFASLKAQVRTDANWKDTEN